MKMIELKRFPFVHLFSLFLMALFEKKQGLVQYKNEIWVGT